MEFHQTDQQEIKGNIGKELPLSNEYYEYGNVEFYFCTFCPFETSLKVNLFDHIHTFHKTQKSAYSVDRVLENYSCNHCDFASFSILLLTKHVYDRCQGKKSKIFNCSYQSNTEESKQRRMVKCDYCSYEVPTRRKYYLKKHLIRKHSGKIAVFECEECSYRTTDQPELVEHTLENHSNWLECEHCEFKTTAEAKLKKHILNKHTPDEEINWFQCGICSYKAQQKYLLDEHMTVVHSDPLITSKRFKCDHCPYITVRNRDLTIHMTRKHSDEIDVLECELCQFKTLDKIKLEGHIHGHNQDGQEGSQKSKVSKNFACVQCSYTTKKGVDFKRHVLTRHADLVTTQWLRCEYCSFKSKDKAYLRRHIRRKHKLFIKRQCSFQCDQCTYKAELKNLLDEHVTLVHGDSTESKWFKCDHCPYTCLRKSDFTNHMKRKHPDKSEVLKCDVCKFKTLDDVELKEHVRKRHVEKTQKSKMKAKDGKEFFCDRCSYTTKKTSDFKRHMLARHPDFVSDPWLNCEYCSFKSKENGHFKRHMLQKHTMFTEKRWFKCGRCSYKVEQKYLLDEHVNTTHGDSLTESGFNVIIVPT